MANTWGGSWGSSWGSSWGASTATTTAPSNHPGAAKTKYFYRVRINGKYHNVRAEYLDEFLKENLRKAVKTTAKRDEVQARRVPVEEAEEIKQLPVYREIVRHSDDPYIATALAWAAYELAIELDDEEVLPLLIH